MPSLRSIVHGAALTLVFRRLSVDADLAERQIAAQATAPRRPAPPDGLTAVAVGETVAPSGWPVPVLTPTVGSPVAEVVHFHGGAYVAELNPATWRFAAAVAVTASARVHLPVYPLAPRATAATTVPEAAELVAEVLARADRPVVVSGDSAGGGLALLATQALRDRGGPLPAALALQAPWLDLRLDHPDLARHARRCPGLTADYLAVAARAWAGDLGVDHPTANPAVGVLDGLPPMLVHVGSRDLGVPDARRLVERAEAAGVAVDLRVVPGQLHGYWVRRLPEARHLRRDLADLVGASS